MPSLVGFTTRADRTGTLVAWVRVDTQTILSIHHNVITQNPRISLTYNDHRSWYLHIREVEESDRGWYMCQVNTDPMRSRKGYLQVVGKYGAMVNGSAPIAGLVIQFCYANPYEAVAS
uniref:Ig domain-containing protein n=1 Tax=Anopheles melas TaxID=34690 RepID=A0A182U1J2_9DIPT